MGILISSCSPIAELGDGTYGQNERRERANSDPSVSARRSDEVWESNTSADIINEYVERSMTQPEAAWQPLSEQRPLPRLPSNDDSQTVNSNETKQPVSRRQFGTTTRSQKPSHRYSTAELVHLLDEANKCAEEKEVEVQRLKTENAALRVEWRGVAASLAETKATVSYVLEDKHFISAWKSLRYQISNWAIQHFGGRLASNFRRWFKSQNPPLQVTELTPYWREYLVSRLLRAAVKVDALTRFSKQIYHL